MMVVAVENGPFLVNYVRADACIVSAMARIRGNAWEYQHSSRSYGVYFQRPSGKFLSLPHFYSASPHIEPWPGGDACMPCAGCAGRRTRERRCHRAASRLSVSFCGSHASVRELRIQKSRARCRPSGSSRPWKLRTMFTAILSRSWCGARSQRTLDTSPVPSATHAHARILRPLKSLGRVKEIEPSS